jgi:hypothetical protein
VGEKEGSCSPEMSPLFWAMPMNENEEEEMLKRREGKDLDELQGLGWKTTGVDKERRDLQLGSGAGITITILRCF